MSQFKPNLLAGGTIRPNRFVKQSTSADNTGLECDANDFPIGVSDASAKDYTSDNHAESGDGITLQDGDINYVEAGAAITAGDQCESDADGRAIPISGTGTETVCGQALEAAGGAGEIIRFWFNVHEQS